MRYISLIVLSFATGCQNQEQEIPEINCPEAPAVETETEDTAADTATETEVEEATYWVSVGGGQVAETNTRLEFISATYELRDDPLSAVDVECFTLTLGVPEDAGQGVLLQNLDYAVIGTDANQSGWTNGFVSTANGPTNYWLAGDLNIFVDEETTVGAVAYNTQTYIDDWGDIAEMFGCQECGTTVFLSFPQYYIPVGGQAIIGACTPWVQYDNNTDYQQEQQLQGAYGLIGENDYHRLILDSITWKPSDTLDIKSDSVDGLFLPTGVSTFAN